MKENDTEDGWGQTSPGTFTDKKEGFVNRVISIDKIGTLDARSPKWGIARVLMMKYSSLARPLKAIDNHLKGYRIR